ncbi:hypothetical protein D3C79_853470 [compost metagenome]
MAVHQVAGQVMRKLVHRGGREAVTGLEQAEEVVTVGHQPVVVHTRVALIDGHGVLPMGLLDGPELLRGQFEGFLPADRLPAVSDALVWRTQAIRIVLDILQGHRLGADMAAAEAVLGVALDRSDARGGIGFVGDLQGQAADGFT